MKLRGDRCQCTACGLYFNSTAAFDKHRVGDHRVTRDRRCLTPQQMQERGMEQTSEGWWVTERRPKYVRAA